MLLENFALLLSASDILAEASWSSLWIPTAVLCSFLMGRLHNSRLTLLLILVTYCSVQPIIVASLTFFIVTNLRRFTERQFCFHRDKITHWVLLNTAYLLCIPGVISVTVYYRFLHPKSTEILQSLHRSQTAQASLEQASSVGEKSVPEPSVHRHGTFSITGYAQTLGQSGQSELSTEKPGVIPSHHLWLLICLAVKTGDWNKVTLTYGPEALAALMDVNEPQCLIEPVDLESAPKHDNEEQLSDKRESQYITVSTSVRHSPPSEDKREAMEKEPSPDSPDSGPRRGCPEGRSGLEESVEMDCDLDDSDTTLYFSADPTTPHCAGSIPAVVRDGHLENMARLSPVPNREPLQLGTKELLSREPCFTSTPKHDLKTKGHIGPRPTGFRRQVQFK